MAASVDRIPGAEWEATVKTQRTALVTGANRGIGGSLLATPPEVLRSTFETNFRGAAWTCRAWVPGMIDRGHGRVVNLSSGYGRVLPGSPADRLVSGLTPSR